MHLFPCTCPTNCQLHDKVLLMLHGHVIADHSYAGWGLIWVMGALGAVLHEFLTTSYQFYDIIIWSATRWEVCIWRCNTLLCWITCLMPKFYTQLVSWANLNSFAILTLKVFPEIIRVEDWWVSLRHLFQFFWYVKSEKLVLKLLQHLKRFSEGLTWDGGSMKWVEVKMKELGVLSHPDYRITALIDHLAMITVQSHSHGVFDCKPLAVIWGKFPEVRVVKVSTFLTSL